MNRQMRRLQAKEETRAKKQQQQPAPATRPVSVLQMMVVSAQTTEIVSSPTFQT